MDSLMLAVLLADLLAAARLAIADTDEGIPDRSYVSHGPPAFDLCEDDCDLLTVHAATVRVEQQQAGGGCALQLVYPLVVTLVRGVPAVTGSGVPTAAELNASALALAADGQALLDGLIDALGAGTLWPAADFAATGWPAGVGCGQVRWAPGLAPVNPQGGVGGWTLGLEVRP